MRQTSKMMWMDGAAEAIIAAATLLALVMALGGSHEPRSSLGYRQGMARYEAGDWPQAYETFAALADSGDASSARVAAMMARQGPDLFGQRFEASPERLARWDSAMRGRAALVGRRGANGGAHWADTPRHAVIDTVAAADIP